MGIAEVGTDAGCRSFCRPRRCFADFSLSSSSPPTRSQTQTPGFRSPVSFVKRGLKPLSSIDPSQFHLFRRYISTVHRLTHRTTMFVTADAQLSTLRHSDGRVVARQPAVGAVHGNLSEGPRSFLRASVSPRFYCTGLCTASWKQEHPNTTFGSTSGPEKACFPSALPSTACCREW